VIDDPAHADGVRAPRAGDRRNTEPRWPDVVVLIGAAGVLSALWSMDWASRANSLGRMTFEGGPTDLLAGSALASVMVAATITITSWRWPRWFLLATTLTTAVTAVVVAFSRIAAANNGRQSSLNPYGGTVRTSYEPGAAVGVMAAFVIVAFAFVGFHDSFKYPRS
jgi:ABC-type Fe3+ transport system permease subunit